MDYAQKIKLARPAGKQEHIMQLPMTFSQWFCIVKRRVEYCSSLKKQTCALAVCLFETVSLYIHYN